MGVKIIISFNKILLLFFISISIFSTGSYADAICNDCWRSTSEGSGTCSWHKGVKQWEPDGTYLFSGYRPWGCLSSQSKSKKNDDDDDDDDDEVWYRYVPLMDSPAARIFRKIF